MNNFYKLSSFSLTAASFLFLAACGGGSSSDSSAVQEQASEIQTPEIQTGVFVDSAVGNIAYRTATRSGFTNSAGEFNYVIGETVTFSIGGIELPVVAASTIITPVDIMGAIDSSDVAVVNLARLLQSLDTDGDPTNGISIGEDAHLAAEVITDIDFGDVNFDSDANIINLLANSGSTNSGLIGAVAARAHLDDTLGSLVSDIEEPNTDGLAEGFNVADLAGEDLSQKWNWYRIDDAGDQEMGEFIFTDTQVCHEQSQFNFTGTINLNGYVCEGYTITDGGELSGDIAGDSSWILLYKGVSLEHGNVIIAASSDGKLMWMDTGSSLEDPSNFDAVDGQSYYHWADDNPASGQVDRFMSDLVFSVGDEYDTVDISSINGMNGNPDDEIIGVTQDQVDDNDHLFLKYRVSSDIFLVYDAVMENGLGSGVTHEILGLMSQDRNLLNSIKSRYEEINP